MAKSSGQIIDITLDQFDDMKHAVGYSRDMVKRGVYEAYRNYYHNGHKPNDDWEDLCEKGYATNRLVEDGVNLVYVYHVSSKGISLLEKLLNINIRSS